MNPQVKSMIVGFFRRLDRGFSVDSAEREIFSVIMSPNP